MAEKYAVQKLAGVEYISEEKHPNTWAYIQQSGTDIQDQYVPNADFDQLKAELTDEGYDKYFIEIFDELPEGTRTLAKPIVKIIKLYDKGKDDSQRGWNY